MRAQPLINCRDVQASSRWYQKLLDCVGGRRVNKKKRLWDPRLHTSKWGADGLILQLHAWEVDHHHGPMGDPTASVGNGVLLWFEVDDFDAAVARARELKAPIVLDVHHNPNADHKELWIRDPDGYTVVLASPDGEAKESTMPIVDFVNVSSAGLESSPVAPAHAGLRANEARYFKNKYDHVFTVEPASKAKATIDWVHRILEKERGLVIESRPLEATAFEVENI